MGILNVRTERRQDVNAKIGRPSSDNPKNLSVKIRADKQLISDLDFCCKETGQTKSDIVREGIRLVKERTKSK